MHVVARKSLAPFIAADRRPRLLLEGSWNDAASHVGNFLALDDLIDGRDAWIDEAASHLAEQLVEPFYFVNALRLRYAFVKWLRILAFRRRCPWEMQLITLHISTSDHDAEYAALWTAVAEADGLKLEVVYHDSTQSPKINVGASTDGWRKTLGRVAARMNLGPRRTPTSERVLLCGNPRILGPICDELLRRNAQVAWLFDRFAVRPWLRWRPRGVSFFDCDTRCDERTIQRDDAPPIVFDGVRLSSTIEAWRDGWLPHFGADQARQQAAVARHFAAFQPTRIVIDEDATPLKRIVVAESRRRGATSSVVQHGACGIRFGFAPLLADRIVVGDEGSRRQLEQWDVPTTRVVVAGTTYQEQFLRDFAAAEKHVDKKQGCSILLIGTTPPRDERPDAVTYCLTSRSYEAMLTAAFTAASEIADATLVVRPHPRTVDDPVLRAVRARFPNLRVHVSRADEPLARLAAEAAVVLSCASSAGIDIAQAGRPVIQLLPEGSGNVLPAEWYGLIGSARTLAELRDHLRHIPISRPAPTAGNVTSQITNAILGHDGSTSTPSQPVERESAYV